MKVRAFIANRDPEPPGVARPQALNIPLKIQGTIVRAAFV
jgi:hypothetical protein